MEKRSLMDKDAKYQQKLRKRIPVENFQYA